MKTVCKKLFSLLLVAVLLVSAVPFQAFASEMYTFYIELWVDEAKVTYKPVSVPAGTNMDEAGIKAYAQEYLYPEYFGEGYEYVRVEEEKVVTADHQGAAIFFKTVNTDPCAAGHTWNAGEVTTPATCTAPGVKTFACTVCGEPKTEPVAQLQHTFVNGVCACGEEDGTGLTLYLRYDGGVKIIQMTEGGKVPSLTEYNPPKANGQKFSHWKSDKGYVLTAGTPWSASFGVEFTPVYVEGEDGLSELNIWVVYDVDGVLVSSYKLMTEYFDTTEDNTMFRWMYSTGGIQSVRDALAANPKNAGYQWDPVIYYNYFIASGKAGYAVTEADMASDGPKNVCIKLDAKEETKAEVLVYIHKGKTTTVSDILELKGFTAGNYVYVNHVKAALKDAGYNYSAISNLYTQAEWNDLIKGNNASGGASVLVSHNGTTKIHVMLTNATVSNNADPSNPKTGDYITIAVTTMVLAAAALVSITELKKRKMI